MRARELAVGLAAALLVACSSPQATPTPTAEPTPTPSPTAMPSPSPTASQTALPGLTRSAAAQAYLEAAVGYEVVSLPLPLETDLVAQLSEGLQSDPNAVAAIRGYAVASMAQAGTGVAVGMIFDADPSYTSLPGFFEGVTAGFAPTGSPGETTTIAGLPAYVTSIADGVLIVYLDGNMIVMVMGTDQAELTALAEALASGNA